MKSPKRRWRLVIAAGGMLILVFALRQQILPLPARWLDVGGIPQKVDAVVLLNGGYNTRPFVAAALVHGGWAPKVIFSTVAAHANQVSGEVPPSFAINLEVLAYGGVPREQVVLLPADVKTTFDEAQAVAGYLAEHPARKIMIVTEGPHTRRADWIFRRVLADRSDREVEVVMYSAPTDGFDSGNWWRNEQGFLFVASECLKLLYYCLRYGWLGYELVIGAIAMILFYAWFARRRKLSGMI